MLLAFAVSGLIAFLATPGVIRFARQTGFLDKPVGYKAHGVPTPYLGGAVILAGFVAGALADLKVQESHLFPIFAGAAVLWTVGTIDDRIALGPTARVAAEVVVAILLWRSDLGWSIFPGEAADLAVTVLWFVGIVNAFNLMDNMDGAAGTVGAVSAGGIALLGAQHDQDSLAALAFAVSGACMAFLYYNLARPSRIFLGDGGSMLLGFLVAALSMAVWRRANLDGVDILPVILFAGLPILDMTLVIVSRLRRRIPLATGGRDHITYRLRSKLGSAHAVAVVLALGQALLCAASIVLIGWPKDAVLIATGVAFLLGVAVIAIFESPIFRYPVAAAGGDPAGLSGSGELGVGAQALSGSNGRDRVELMPMSTPRSDGATVGRSRPSTGPGP